MTEIRRRWLYDSLAIAAIACSGVLLFALFELDAPGWISSLNVLAVLLVVLGMKAGRPSSGAKDRS